MVVDMGNAPLGALLTDNFHDAEEGYRWTRGTSRMRFLDSGASPTARVEIALAGFRPRGTRPPLLVIESGGETLRRSPGRRAELYKLETRTEGVWSSTLDVSLRSDTFSPGAGDDRSLGVRVHEARLVLPNGVEAAAPPARSSLGARARRTPRRLSMAGLNDVWSRGVGRRHRGRGGRLRVRPGLGDDPRPGPRRRSRRRSHREMALAGIHPGDRGNDLTVRECACGWSRDSRERLGCLRGRPRHFRDRVLCQNSALLK